MRLFFKKYNPVFEHFGKKIVELYARDIFQKNLNGIEKNKEGFFLQEMNRE